MTTLTIALPEALAAWIDAQVARGEYVDASDDLRTLIRRDAEGATASAELWADILQGFEGAPSPGTAREMFEAVIAHRFAGLRGELDAARAGGISELYQQP